MILPSGLLFDSYGAQITGTLGCVLLVTGLLVLILLLSGLVPVAGGLEYPIFITGILLVDFGSFTNNMMFFGFIYHLPGHQALIISLSTCCYQVSSLLPIAIEYLMDSCGLSFTVCTYLCLHASIHHAHS